MADADAAPPAGPATGPAPAGGDTAFFLALERRRTAALVARNLPLLEALHAPDYQLITPSGRVFSRQRYLEAIARAPFYAAWEIGEFACRAGADRATVRYQARLVFPSGKPMHCWHTDSYEWSGQAWWAVWSQATAIAPPDPA